MYTPLLQIHTPTWSNQPKLNQQYLKKESTQFYILPEGKETYLLSLNGKTNNTIDFIDPRSWSREEVLVWL